MPTSVATGTRQAAAPAPRVASPIPAPAARVSSTTSRSLFATSAPPALRLAGGTPLTGPIRGRLESSFGADLGAVRVHNDGSAAVAADRLSTKAFAFGPSIFLGSGARSNDLGLMAHEVAHTIQQRTTRTLQRFTPGGSGAHETEAHRASAAAVRGERFAVIGRTAGPQVQGLFGVSPLDFFADKANLIPGFRMFTIVLGVNPINMSRVERNAANILRALIEFIPGGGLIVQALDNSGIFEQVGNWVEQQIRALGMAGSAIKDAVARFIQSLDASDLFNLGGVWDRAKRIFTEPIDRIINFAKSTVTGIIKFIKDAILRPLAKLAENTRGYDLLKAVLGEDPVTGDKVPQTAETLIGGFMKLIGQEEIWENLKKANAVTRAWAWFQNALSGLMAFVRQVPSLFVKAFKSLELLDIVLVPRAFLKVAAVFGGFIVDFLKWAGDAVWKLLEIILEVVAPNAIPYIKKAGASFRKILEHPLDFFKNLLMAGKKGFERFGTNIGKHLKNSLIGWLTGSLGGTGIYIPKALELREIVKFALSVLGLTWQNIRQKLVNAIGETAVKAMEQGFQLVVTLVTQGPTAAWEQMKEMVKDMQTAALEEIRNFVATKVIEAAVTKLISMLSPVGALIQALIAIYNTAMFLIERLKQIIQVVTAFIDSVSAIAAGIIDSAAERIENTLAGLLTLAISFLARIAGLGKVSDAVIKIIKKIRAPIDKALDALIGWIVKMGKSFLDKLSGAVTGANDTPEQKQKRVRDGATAAVAAVSKYSGKKVGAIILKPLLALVQIRYRLTKLEPVRQGEDWYVRAEINPVEMKKTGVKAGKDVAEVKIIYEAHWPLDEFRSKAGAIKRAAESKPVSSAKTLPIDLSTGKQQSTHGARKGGQAAFRNEIHAFIDRVADVNDQKTARDLMAGLQADHQQELQMSGTDDPANMAMIESRMNSQLGAMFRGQLKDLSDEATLEKVHLDEKDAKPGQHRESGKARELETLLLKHAVALQTAPATVKSWFKL